MWQLIGGGVFKRAGGVDYFWIRHMFFFVFVLLEVFGFCALVVKVCVLKMLSTSKKSASMDEELRNLPSKEDWDGLEIVRVLWW